MDRLSNRIRWECYIMVFAFLTAALTIPYVVLLSKAAVGSPAPSKGTLYLMYLVPPFGTVILAIVNICSFLTWQELLAPWMILVTFIMSLGWTVVAVFWGHCATGDPVWSSKLCYQDRVAGAQDYYSDYRKDIYTLGIFVMLAGIMMLSVYVVCFTSAVKDLYLEDHGLVRYKRPIVRQESIGIIRRR